MKKKLLILGCICVMMLGQVQAMPAADCERQNSIGVRLYYAGFTNIADSIFRYLNDRGCYDGDGL